MVLATPGSALTLYMEQTMTKANRVHSTPPTNTSAINNNLPFAIAGFSASPAIPLRRDAELFRLRKQAADVVERLIAFLDASDGYTTDERDEAVDATFLVTMTS
jgi:hypothetical protein